MKRYRLSQDLEIGPQEELYLLLAHDVFPSDQFFSILASFGGFEVETQTAKETTCRIDLITPKGVSLTSATSHLSRIEGYVLDYAPAARWQVGLWANSSFESRWLTHALAYHGLVLLDACILYRPSDGKTFHEPEVWYRYLQKWFWSERFVSLGLAAENGQLLI